MVEHRLQHPDGFGHHHGNDIPLDPPELAGVDPLSMRVLSSYRKTTHLNRQLFARLAAGKGGHPGRTMVLGMIERYDGISQRDLAEKMHLARPTVTIMLQKMEAEGIIERWDDPEDQRLTRIRLTDAGRAQSAGMHDAYVAYIDSTIGSLSEDDRTEFARLLDLLNDHATTALKELDA
jgi:DNA-binding MarR family transcriptional regulator